MTITRRDAIRISGSTLAGLSLTSLAPDELASQAAPQEWPQTLVEQNLRNLAPLPLNEDGSAPEHPESAAGAIQGRLMWRTQGQTPPGEYDYRQMRIRVDTRGLARLRGTMTFADLEPLPRVSHTFLMQCGTPEPTGIVKWTGVRFRDFAEMLGVQPGAHYCRFIATDRHYVDEELRTLMHPQVMLAWMMNDEPISPDHGAPLRLVVPFRYGNRSIKAITDIIMGTPGLPALQFPG
jgi:DMSO/TMAO reductase YedYZ molybdopterin-dependent catalytic subunit